MCKLVSPLPGDPGHFGLDPGEELEFSDVFVTTIDSIDAAEGMVIQCWHPETGEWATMLPPVEGMVWELTPGSKIRAVPAKDAPPPEPSMVEQVEAVR